MSPYRKNILVGLTVLGAGLVIGWMVLTFSSKTAELFAPPQMPAHFFSSRADGLSSGSAVMYKGVEVGRVTSVSVKPDGSGVEIDAELDRTRHIPENIQAQITQTSMLGGGAVVSLELAEGDQPVGEFKPDTKLDAKYIGLQLNLIPPSMAATAGQIGAMSEEFRKTSQQLRESGVILDLDKTVQNINARTTRAGEVLDSLQSLLGDETMRNDLKQAIASLKSTTDNTNRISAKLDKLIDSVQNTSDTANTALKDTQQHVDDLSKQLGDRMTQMSTLLASVQSISEKIDKGQGTAGQLVNDPHLYQALVDSSRELNATVSDLKRLVEQWEQEGVTLRLK